MAIAGHGAGALLLIALLGGCVEVQYDVEVTSDTTARTSMRQVMARSSYDMIQANKDVTAPSRIDRNFCKTGTMVIGGDDVVCTIIHQGPFAALADTGGAKLVAAGPGMVRVVFPIGDQKREPDDTLAAMWQEMAAGHGVVLTVTGGEIVATNMGLALDKRSARIEMGLGQMLAGTSTLPDDLFAIVRVEQP